MMRFTRKIQETEAQYKQLSIKERRERVSILNEVCKKWEMSFNIGARNNELHPSELFIRDLAVDRILKKFKNDPIQMRREIIEKEIEKEKKTDDTETKEEKIERELRTKRSTDVNMCDMLNKIDFGDGDGKLLMEDLFANKNSGKKGNFKKPTGKGPGKNAKLTDKAKGIYTEEDENGNLRYWKKDNNGKWAVFDTDKNDWVYYNDDGKAYDPDDKSDPDHPDHEQHKQELKDKREAEKKAKQAKKSMFGSEGWFMKNLKMILIIGGIVLFLIIFGSVMCCISCYKKSKKK